MKKSVKKTGNKKKVTLDLEILELESKIAPQSKINVNGAEC